MTRIKICGMTRAADAVAAVEAGADAIGLVFWARSPRAVDEEQARDIASTLPPFVSVVGVFVDETRDNVRTIADFVGLTAVQLHGREEPEDWMVFPRPVVKAMPLASYEKNPWRATDAGILVDAHDPVTIGGTGRTIDWQQAAAIASERHLVLAGGLRPENVGDAVAIVAPWAVDVASGVESAPGIKDHARMRAFIAAVREADAARQRVSAPVSQTGQESAQ